MSADTQEISKVDSAVGGLSSSPKDAKAEQEKKRRTTSSAPGVMNINDLGELPREPATFPGEIPTHVVAHLELQSRPRMYRRRD